MIVPGIELMQVQYATGPLMNWPYFSVLTGVTIGTAWRMLRRIKAHKEV